MNATFAPQSPAAGNVAFMSQSGGLGIELMSQAAGLGIGSPTSSRSGTKPT
jgi:acyl-CoA synthetase (NDP forming)